MGEMGTGTDGEVVNSSNSLLHRLTSELKIVFLCIMVAAKMTIDWLKFLVHPPSKARAIKQFWKEIGLKEPNNSSAGVSFFCTGL